MVSKIKVSIHSNDVVNNMLSRSWCAKDSSFSMIGMISNMMVVRVIMLMVMMVIIAC